MKEKNIGILNKIEKGSNHVCAAGLFGIAGGIATNTPIAFALGVLTVTGAGIPIAGVKLIQLKDKLVSKSQKTLVKKSSSF